jgi:hypothetical protein
MRTNELNAKLIPHPDPKHVECGSWAGLELLIFNALREIDFRPTPEAPLKHQLHSGSFRKESSTSKRMPDNPHPGTRNDFDLHRALRSPASQFPPALVNCKQEPS